MNFAAHTKPSVANKLTNNPAYFDLVAEHNGHISYEDWCEELGLDDSFVGNGIDTPGTSEIYDGAIAAYKAES